MTTKEKIVREAIEKVEKELSEIISILDAEPLIEIIKNRQLAQSLLNEYKGRERQPEFLSKLSAFSRKEKDLFALAEKQQKTPELISRRVELDLELRDLNNELYHIERKKQSTP